MLVAIIVALLVQSRLSPKSEGAAALPQTEILVAAKPLATGARLSEANVRWQAVPETAVFPGAILKSSEPDLAKLTVYDSPVRRPIEAGEPINRNAVVDVKGAGSAMAAGLGEGMRAVSVAVNATRGVAGFVAPGDRVDLILSYTPRFAGDARDIGEKIVSRNAAQTIISNVRVLAVDQTASEQAGQIKVAKTVTLELTKEQSEIVVLATDMGELSLALRRLGEEDAADAPATPVTTDAAVSEIVRKVNEAMRKSEAVTSTIRVYSGSGVQNVPVRVKENPQPAAGGQQP